MSGAQMTGEAAAPILGLALIAKDEEECLPRLLASVEGAFDQVALLDTGSTDRTVEVFEEWAQAQGLPLGYKLGHFEWCDDFAAARNAANELLDTRWLCWADCDDEIIDADRLRRVIASLPADASIVSFPYENYFGENSRPLIYPRLFRFPHVHWGGRVHEGPRRSWGKRYDFVEGDHLPRWQHCCQSLDSHRPRNFRILHKWAEEEPDEPEPFALLVAECVYTADRAGMVEHATALLERFGNSWSPEQREIARWAVDGLCLRVDEAHPTQIQGMNALLPRDPVTVCGGYPPRARAR